MLSSVQIPEKRKRQFLPESFKVENWDDLKPYYDNLLNRSIESQENLETWMQNRTELNSIVAEDVRWRYIRWSCNSTNKAVETAYNDFIEKISPNISPYTDGLNRKLLDSPFMQFLNQDQLYIYLRGLKNAVELYRTENIKLVSEIQVKNNTYGVLLSKMMITWEGEEMTIKSALNLLHDTDSAIRKTAYEKIVARRMQDAEKLENLFDDLLGLRHKMALNAGFDNYRDFKFRELGRFDYEISDCFDFHKSIKEEVVPVLDKQMSRQKEALKVESLRPWDTEINPSGKPPLLPFNSNKELVEKTVQCLEKVDPFFANCLKVMDSMKHMDLDSRKGKRPGGYNMSLPETGVPFIFMNSSNSIRDMRTMIHESGHAVHNFLMLPIELNSNKRPPSEVAELAAMSMELLSLDYWDVFFDNEEDLRRAKRWQLENVLTTLPWVALIDKFQHWLYTNPKHSIKERKTAWVDMYHQYSSKVIDYTGFENYIEALWQKQIHLFEVPFYYIEYGMAQLGAIAIWRNYKMNGPKSLEAFKNALSLGYTRSIPEIYETAGIDFNFSKSYVGELVGFVKAEIKKLED